MALEGPPLRQELRGALGLHSESCTGGQTVLLHSQPLPVAHFWALRLERLLGGFWASLWSALLVGTLSYLAQVHWDLLGFGLGRKLRQTDGC
jgi:hypothetical protein